MIRVLKRLNRAINLSDFKLTLLVSWAFKRTEFSNYYYGITDRNLKHLISMLSALTLLDDKMIKAYLDEIIGNVEIQEHFRNFIKKNPELRDSHIQFGRRLFWYGLIRITKPRLVIETGISHGVGSCLIAQALLRNESEGFEGIAIGTEINTNCGSLVTEPWNKKYKIIYGDSLSTLRNIENEVDIFINDSDHDANYELKEYQTIFPKLSSNGIFIADNAHASDSLVNFSNSIERFFLFFAEKPSNHWYPGSGVGISFASLPLKIFQN